MISPRHQQQVTKSHGSRVTVLYVKRVGNTLMPDGDESVAAMASVPFGKSLKAEIKMQRNVAFHRLFFALCKRIGDGVGVDAENIATIFKLATGHYTLVKSKRHGELKIPKSISFAKLDNISFTEFVNKCIRVAYEEWGIDPASLEDLLVPEAQHQRK